jgi:hypothetical protein
MESVLTASANPISPEAKLTPNQALYHQRLSHDLKVHEAAHAMGITTLELYLAERGYVRLSKRVKKAAISFYQCDPALFEDDLQYPTPIEDAAPKKTSKLLTFAFSWRGVLLCAIASVLAWGCFGGGYGLAVYSRVHALEYYDQSYNDFAFQLINKGTASSSGEEFSYTYTAANEETFDVTVSLDSHKFGLMEIGTSFDSDDDHSIMLSYQQKDGMSLAFSFIDYKLSLEDLTESEATVGSGMSKDGVYHTNSIMIGASLTETSEEQYFVDLDTRLNAHAKTIEGYYYELVKGIEYTDGTGFYDLLK